MSFWSRLFGRKPSVIDARHMSEDWKIGDLALCIRDDWTYSDLYDPHVGDLLHVSAIRDGVDERSRTRIIGLAFREKPFHFSWSNMAFRKAKEVSEPAEAEFTALIKRPVRELGPELVPSFDDSWKVRP